MSIIYLIIFLLGCFLFSQIERYYKIPFAKWIFIIPFCLIIANRDITVPDTEQYINYLNSENSNLTDYEDLGFEVGFQTYTKLIKSLFDDNEILYFALITITNLLIINFSINRISNSFRQEQERDNSEDVFIGGNRFFEDSAFSVLPLTLYVAFFGIYFNAIVLRVGIALSLLVLTTTIAIKKDKNSWDYILIALLLIVGYLIHATAAIGVLLILTILFTKEFSKKTYLTTWLSIGFVYFSNMFSMLGNSVFSFATSLNSLTVLSEKLSNYEGEVTYDVDGISMKFVFFWVMALVLIINSPPSKIYFKYLNVYILGLILIAFFRSVLLIERVSDYFLLFSFVMFYLYLLLQRPDKFWLYYVSIIFIQLLFVLRITNREMN